MGIYTTVCIHYMGISVIAFTVLVRKTNKTHRFSTFCFLLEVF